MNTEAMNPRRAVAIVLLLPCAAALAAGDTAPVSETAEQRIMEKLPEYDPGAAEAARETAALSHAGDELVVLPEMTVIERQQRRMAEEDMYKKGLLDEQLVKKELSDLDRSLLNRYRLPFIGMSNGARARELYLLRKNKEFKEQVERTAAILSSTDPQEAKRLRAGLNGWK